jgi:hypothetical protein
MFIMNNVIAFFSVNLPTIFQTFRRLPLALPLLEDIPNELLEDIFTRNFLKDSALRTFNFNKTPIY